VNCLNWFIDRNTFYNGVKPPPPSVSDQFIIHSYQQSTVFRSVVRTYMGLFVRLPLSLALSLVRPVNGPSTAKRDESIQHHLFLNTFSTFILYRLGHMSETHVLTKVRTCSLLNVLGKKKEWSTCCSNMERTAIIIQCHCERLVGDNFAATCY